MNSMQTFVILRSFLQWRWQWASIGHFVFLFVHLYHFQLHWQQGSITCPKINSSHSCGFLSDFFWIYCRLSQPACTGKEAWPIQRLSTLPLLSFYSCDLSVAYSLHLLRRKKSQKLRRNPALSRKHDPSKDYRLFLSSVSILATYQ